MTRKTNLDKWKLCKSLIDERAATFIQSQVQALPAEVYRVSPNGTIIIYKITGTVYMDGFYCFNNKPSNLEVEKIRAAAINGIEFDRANIRINYTQEYGQGSVSQGSFKLDDLADYLTIEQAEAKASGIREQIQREEELLKNGHDRCQRCRKVVPKNTIVHKTIIGRGRNEVWNSWKGRMESKATVTSELMLFCSGECAAHEQMSREG